MQECVPGSCVLRGYGVIGIRSLLGSTRGLCANLPRRVIKTESDRDTRVRSRYECGFVLPMAVGCFVSVCVGLFARIHGTSHIGTHDTHLTTHHH